ncbi:MAG: hypothetical protein COZ85_01230 [Candidatus Moranbacteria bacterium CG_4_8_14_3_um_filter_34_16]|nr:MAG: hypothetical protein COZ85_01230 [Candidatus Moranbacteria bacterium CG_4_8_14_3_um_filter_34_16]
MIKKIVKMINGLSDGKVNALAKLLGVSESTLRPKRSLLCKAIGCKFYNQGDDKNIYHSHLVKCRFNDQIVDTFKDKCSASASGKFKKYGFFCNGCKERLGTAYTVQNSPQKDRIDFKYDQPIKDKKGKKIKGCACPSITQDGELAFECYCGNDTRDFRGHKNHADKEKDNSKGRQWGKKDSKFRVEKVEV